MLNWSRAHSLALTGLKVEQRYPVVGAINDLERVMLTEQWAHVSGTRPASWRRRAVRLFMMRKVGVRTWREVEGYDARPEGDFSHEDMLRYLSWREALEYARPPHARRRKVEVVSAIAKPAPAPSPEADLPKSIAERMKPLPTNEQYGWASGDPAAPHNGGGGLPPTMNPRRRGWDCGE